MSHQSQCCSPYCVIEAVPLIIGRFFRVLQLQVLLTVYSSVIDEGLNAIIGMTKCMIMLVSIIGRIQFAFTDIQPANSCQDVYR